MAQSSNYSVNLSANKFLGSYLVNQSGFALYYSTSIPGTKQLAMFMEAAKKTASGTSSTRWINLSYFKTRQKE